jgi:hypothetical protein
VEPFASGFAQLGNIAVDGDGDGSVIATDRNGHRVFRVTPDGAVAPVAGNGLRTGGGDGFSALETGLNQVRGVWIHPGGGYFLATQAGSQVWYVDTRGTIHLFLDGLPGNIHDGDGQPFETPGKKVSAVRSVTMDCQLNLLICENDFGYVRRVLYVPAPPCG